jgi:hypothetical protein
MSFCAPSKTGNRDSCYDDDDLELLINVYNSNSNKKIDPDIPRSEKIKALLDVFSDECKDDQICWLNHSKVRNDVYDTDIEETTFVPRGPTKEQEWLSNHDILNTMIQYEEIYPSFHFIGAEPCNFLKLSKNNRSVFDDEDLRRLYNEGKQKIGLVLNTQGYEQGGEHWVSIYADLDKNLLYYFDSNGDKPFNDAKVFMNRVCLLYTSPSPRDV